MSARAWLAGLDEAEAIAGLLVEFRDHMGGDWPSENAFLASVERLLEDRGTEFLLAAPDDDAPPAGVLQLRFRFSVWKAAPRRLDRGRLRSRRRPPCRPRRCAGHARPEPRPRARRPSRRARHQRGQHRRPGPLRAPRVHDAVQGRDGARPVPGMPAGLTLTAAARPGAAS